MVKVIYGKKGMGKTKILLDAANAMALEDAKNVVFIDDSNQLMYNLSHKVRFINVSEFPPDSPPVFIGFLHGIISSNYDVNGIFIDGLTYFLKEDINALEQFFKEINCISQKYNIAFYISINGDLDKMPEYLKEYAA
ncbi:hypothetical protein DFR58_1092 [Anaerobacterium chartisolvens]|uniref:ATP-binding protein n=1 Tax=Anaerobacterium chartisolvens TaxID=1297424 RepID=A0A369B8A9_9FIRM|nr:hypothetical protein [Anaerobacterium chartisolvens]RCX16777.1 hypothetical protein DFR58_1092 [Anaerobacterium chartisolvens]